LPGIGSKSFELGISLVVASARSAHYQREFWLEDGRQPVDRFLSHIVADLIAANNAGLSGNPFVFAALLISENSL
jgi:hypothetical protein